MIPILYDSTETAFASNGLGRLRDCISCVVTEERNGIYECDFEYPTDGINYDRIQLGRIIAVEHDESGDVQPFDIVSYSRPINGVVTFHAVHISYRQTALTCTGSNINSLADAFTLFGTALPDNPFNYWTDKDSIGFMASADGVPHSVRTMLGGMEGSVIDAYGGEYEWDNWTVKLWSERGSLRNFTIRYGVNLVNYEEELDYSDTYTAVLPYWKGQDASGNDIAIVGDMVDSGYPSFNGSERCIPLDVTDKFDTEDGQPTKAQIEAEGLAYINANQPYLPAQTLKVDFARITDSPEYAQFANLQKCRLCDSITVMFPKYKTEGIFKIVKTEYDVLQERYFTLELGTLAVTLSEALGINQEAANRVRYGGGGGGADDYVVEQGTSGDWVYRKWDSGIAECWQYAQFANLAMTTAEGYGYYAALKTINFPSGLFNSVAPVVTVGTELNGSLGNFTISTSSKSSVSGYFWASRSATRTVYAHIHAIGNWKV